MNTINLGEVFSKNSKIMSGRQKGNEARKKYRLDELDKDSCEVKVVIPQKVWSVTASFFLGCFGKSVRQLGEVEFRKKYTFDCDEVIKSNIDDGIVQAINITSAIE